MRVITEEPLKEYIAKYPDTKTAIFDLSALIPNMTK
jgi:mRNA-degrading endonuclease HigB of HigAB toxin-antitoxin module